MKRVIIFCALFLFSCSSVKEAKWDGGAQRMQVNQQQQMEGINANTNNQQPSAAPATEMDQPF